MIHAKQLAKMKKWTIGIFIQSSIGHWLSTIGHVCGEMC